MLIFGDRTGFTLLTTTDSKVAYKHFFKRGKCGAAGWQQKVPCLRGKK